MKVASDAVQWLQALALERRRHGDPFQTMTWFLCCGQAFIVGDTAVSSAVSIHPHGLTLRTPWVYDSFVRAWVFSRPASTADPRAHRVYRLALIFRPMTWFLCCGQAFIVGDTAVSSAVSIHPQGRLSEPVGF
jgi:hypothetical protein